jgi:hypothetical protein
MSVFGALAKHAAAIDLQHGHGHVLSRVIEDSRHSDFLGN